MPPDQPEFCQRPGCNGIIPDVNKKRSYPRLYCSPQCAHWAVMEKRRRAKAMVRSIEGLSQNIPLPGVVRSEGFDAVNPVSRESSGQAIMQDVKVLQNLGRGAIEKGGNVFVVNIQVGEISFQDLKSLVSAIGLDSVNGADQYRVTLAEQERQAVIKALKEAKGIRKKAAALLGISARGLQNKINRLRANGWAEPDYEALSEKDDLYNYLTERIEDENRQH